MQSGALASTDGGRLHSQLWTWADESSKRRQFFLQRYYMYSSSKTYLEYSVVGRKVESATTRVGPTLVLDYHH